MALNTEQIDKITKVLRLTSSESDAEALSALRKTQKLLQQEGLELAAILEAGLGKPEKPDFNSIFAGFWNLKGDAPAAPPPPEEPPKPRPKAEIRVSLKDLPIGFFKASVKIYEERRYQTGATMLVLEVFDDGADTIRRYPTMCAFGRQAARIKDVLGKTGNAIPALLRAEKPAQDGRLPKITNNEL
jgi:hypothetical protein